MRDHFSSGDGMGLASAVRESAHVSIGPAQAVGSYSTSFGSVENPISESGRWINGLVTGLDWANMSVSANGARGQQTPDGGGALNFNDATALLIGTWGNDQDATIVARQVSANAVSGMEIEIRLRSELTAHSCTGYEVYWSVQNADQYLNIARWDGPLGSYTNIAQTVSGVAVVDGDTLRATIVGTVITAYINGVQKLQYNTNADGTKYASGKPGIGTWLGNTGGSAAEQANFGIKSFTVTTV